MSARLAWAFAALGLLAGPVVVSAAPAGVSYDQIDAMFFSGATPPPPGSFAAVRAALPSPAAGVTGYPSIDGGFGSLSGLGDLARLQSGIFSHFSSLNGRLRVDDPATGRATIVQTDTGRVIYLDTKARTYRIASPEESKPIVTPQSEADVVAAVEAMQPGASDPGVGTEILTTKSSSSPLDALTIDGISTEGKKTVTEVSGVTTSPACPPIQTTITTVEYVEPAQGEPRSARVPPALPKMPPGLPGLKCRFVNASPEPTASAAADHPHGFTLYRSAEDRIVIPFAGTTFVTTIVTARGNIRELGPDDAALFEIPTGYSPVPAT